MSTELRKVVYGMQSTPAYFHRWFIKTFDDEPGCERPYALLELENGTVKEVRAEEIRFVD